VFYPELRGGFSLGQTTLSGSSRHGTSCRNVESASYASAPRLSERFACTSAIIPAPRVHTTIEQRLISVAFDGPCHRQTLLLAFSFLEICSSNLFDL